MKIVRNLAFACMHFLHFLVVCVVLACMFIWVERISTYLNHDTTHVFVPRLGVNFLAPIRGWRVPPSSLFCLSLSEQHTHCQGLVAALPSHQVRRATGSGKGKINHFIWDRQGVGAGGGGGRGRQTRDEGNRRSSERIRGKKGVIERGEEEKK